jgi:tetratricopeptide (TPR) repeat protein
VEAKTDTLIKADIRDGVRSLGQECSQMTYENAKSYLGNLHKRKQASSHQQSNWLIIFDNADDPSLALVDLIPEGDDGTIIVTSRNRDLSMLAPNGHLDLGTMTEKEALAALLFSSHRLKPAISTTADLATLLDADHGPASSLVSELGCLPLALVQAGNYCWRMSPSNPQAGLYSFREYLEKFRAQRARLMSDPATRSLDNYEYNVYATLDLSYKALPISARQLLHICAFFSNSMIPEDMFKEAIRAGFGDPPGGLPDFPRPDMVREVVQDLRVLFESDGDMPDIAPMMRPLLAFSLLARSEPSPGIWFLNLHPLVSTWARDFFRITRGGSSPIEEVPMVREVEYRSMATQVLISSLTESYHRRGQAYLLPHVFAMLQDLNGLHVQDLTLLARQLRRSSLWQDAEKIDIVVKDICELFYGADHASTIAAYESLARSYYGSERFDPAVPIREMIWHKKEQLLGQDHPETLFAKSQVGLVYLRKRRFLDAEEVQSEVAAQKESLLGPEHPSTLNEKLQLFVTLLSQGKLKEAKYIFQQILDIRRDRGDWDVDKLIAQLYHILRAILGDRQSRPWIISEQLIPIMAQVIGKDPSKKDQHLFLEIISLVVERNQDAEQICINIVERASATLGEQHVLILAARLSIAWIKVVRGDEDAYAAIFETIGVFQRSDTTYMSMSSVE